jgi:hypothetical protein
MISQPPSSPSDNSQPLSFGLVRQVEQVEILQTQPGWEKQIRDADLRFRTRPGLIVDDVSRREVFGEITIPLAIITPHLEPVQVDNRTWEELTVGLFGEMRAMTPAERAEFSALDSNQPKPLKKPLKRLPSF